MSTPRDFQSERAELQKRIQESDEKILLFDGELEEILKKTATMRKRRITWLAKLRAVEKAEKEFFDKRKRQFAVHEKAIARKAIAEQKKVMRLPAVTAYAKANNFTIVDVSGRNDPFMDLMADKYDVEFYKPASFYGLISWIDECCQKTPLKNKYYVKQEAAEKVVERLSLLKKEKLKDLENFWIPKRKESAAAWKFRFINFILRRPYSDLIAPKIKAQMRSWLALEERGRPD